MISDRYRADTEKVPNLGLRMAHGSESQNLMVTSREFEISCQVLGSNSDERRKRTSFRTIGTQHGSDKRRNDGMKFIQDDLSRGTILRIGFSVEQSNRSQQGSIFSGKTSSQRRKMCGQLNSIFSQCTEDQRCGGILVIVTP